MTPDLKINSAATELSEEADSEPGIFERKELLSPGPSVLEVVGNRSERDVLARLGSRERR